VNRSDDTGRPALDDVLRSAWEELRTGAERGRHAWHTPALATLDGDLPAVRTVVLRAALEDQRTLVCHTDDRSPKVAQLQARPRAAWMFYDREAKTQLRATGAVSMHRGDELARERWEAATERSRRCYHQALGPGQALDPARETIPELDEGFGQFVVLQCVLDGLDWLYLRGRGHWRARWRWDGTGWQGAWVAP
jgi:3-hydroxyisobutyrate dehydrogenase